MKKDCWKLKNTQQGNQEEKVDRVSVTEDQFLILPEGDAINFACNETSWIVDSGVTTHVTSYQDLFSTYTGGDYGSVEIRNDSLAQVAGIGDICLETIFGTRLVLKDVKHIPDIRMNLILTRRLDDEGFYSLHGYGKWKLSCCLFIEARGEKSSSFYWMQAKVSKDVVNVVENDGAMELWHKRLGHMSENRMSVLS